MQARNLIASLVAVSTILFLAGCGSSGPKVVPPPSGGFSASNLSGTYVFSSTGADTSGGFLSIVGAFSANGSGGISAGTLDYIDTNVGIASAQSIASGGSSYTVTSDGRGQIKLNAGSTLGLIELDFALTSSSHGLVTEFDGNGSGSGTLDLQSTTSQSQLAGTYTFAISGLGGGATPASYATVGSLTLNSAGLVTAGVEDINNGGAASTLALTTSNVTLGSGTAPGTATLATSSGSYGFDVYAIDSTHIKLVETDGAIYASGDLFTAGTTLPSGTLVYTLSGADTSGYPISGAGYLPTDASGNITGAFEDYNDAGVTLGQSTTVAGAFTPLAGGRSQVTLSGFENGATNDVLGTYTFAAYPFTFSGGSGLELLEVDNAGITSGTAYLQSSTSFAASQGYAMNLSALNTSAVSQGGGLVEEDDIAEFSTTASSLTGIIDLNDEGSTKFDQSFSGNYATGASAGRYTATSNYLTFNLYVVSGSTVLLLETDANQNGSGLNQAGTGIVALQSASSVAPGVANPSVPAPLRPAAAHFAKLHRK